MFRITDEDRSIARLAVPALGALAAEPLVALVDTAFVGRLGEEPLAALGVVNGVLGLAFFLFIVLTYAGTPLIARAVGLGDRDRATRLVNQSIMVAAVLMVVGLVVIEGAAHLLIDLMGAGPEVAPQAVDYLRIRGLGLPALLMITVGSSVYRGVGDTRTTMFVSVGLSLVNLILDPVFIFG
ncbi:MAG: MATE family efflux transporter, partial [Acidimicrobiia bacterium]|nr:MATE family efflux transporter [Acidimicrobiia bacterium]